MRKRRASGFIGEVKSDVILDNCVYDGEIISMGANDIRCGAGLAAYSIAQMDHDYEVNNYILRLTLNNFTTTKRAFLHDYYFPFAINPLIAQVYGGEYGDSFRNFH